ncbi:hypothetical protein ACFVVA_40270 [Kitasatospora sp. NPDC058048]|uniref:hypothetical protein n=1 Tax=Kitasatospora sp. NPDC058048 TaxID=3346313 RepID=UPI0036DBEA36
MAVEAGQPGWFTEKVLLTVAPHGALEKTLPTWFEPVWTRTVGLTGARGALPKTVPETAKPTDWGSQDGRRGGAAAPPVTAVLAH